MAYRKVNNVPDDALAIDDEYAIKLISEKNKMVFLKDIIGQNDIFNNIDIKKNPQVREICIELESRKRSKNIQELPIILKGLGMGIEKQEENETVYRFISDEELIEREEKNIIPKTKTSTNSSDNSQFLLLDKEKYTSEEIEILIQDYLNLHIIFPKDNNNTFNFFLKFKKQKYTLSPFTKLGLSGNRNRLRNNG